MKILAIIPARGGSKGIPKKNIKPLAGKPLIAWTIKAAKGSKYINRTVVSSDSKEILAISKRFGAETIKRPSEISGDHSPFHLLISHVLETLRKKEDYSPDFIVFLQPTSPLRKSYDIDGAVKQLVEKKAGALISVCAVDKKFLKAFLINNKGYLNGAFNNKYPFLNRQNLPDLFMPNGAIYIVKTNIFIRSKQLFASRTVPFIMRPEKSIDVDSLEDLYKIERILKSASS